MGRFRWIDGCAVLAGSLVALGCQAGSVTEETGAFQDTRPPDAPSLTDPGPALEPGIVPLDGATDTPDILPSSDAGAGSVVAPDASTAPPPSSPYEPARYLVEDFENDGWAGRYQIAASDNVTRETGVAARSGSYGMRIHAAIGEHWGGRILWDHARHDEGGNLNEIWARYYIRFGPNFGRDEAIYIGKAGYRGRSSEVCRAPCLEMTDSVHMSESGGLGGRSYYHRGVSDANLAEGTFDHHGRDWTDEGDRERERWYCIETHLVLNTPGVGNGVYQNWVDGRLVSDQDDFRYRDSATFDFDSSVLMFYVGGGWVSDRDMSVYFDDWALSDTRIGCD